MVSRLVGLALEELVLVGGRGRVEVTVYRANGPRNGFAVEVHSQVKEGVDLALVDGLMMISWSLNLRHCTCYFEL